MLGSRGDVCSRTSGRHQGWGVGQTHTLGPNPCSTCCPEPGLPPSPSHQQKPYPGPLPCLLPAAWSRSICRQGEVLKRRHHASLACRRGLMVVAAPVQLMPMCHCILRLACVRCSAHRCSSCMAETQVGPRALTHTGSPALTEHMQDSGLKAGACPIFSVGHAIPDLRVTP